MTSLSPSDTAGREQAIGRFDFGGLAVSLTSSSRPWAELIQRRYGAFATRRRADWRVACRLNGSGVPSPEFLRHARQQPIRGRRRGGRLTVATPTFEMVLDPGRRVACLESPLATYPVDRLIQTLWYETQPRGLIVHGAALADGDQGWLASGPSGSGKSTLAALLPERALCDEFTAVALDADAPRLGALPFWASRRGDAELAGIYLLRHGDGDRRRRLTPGEAFSRLRREVLWPTWDEEALRRAFAALFELPARVPVWDLAWRPRRAIWDLIRQEAAA